MNRFHSILVTLTTVTALLLHLPQPANASDKTLHILCSTFPIYQITRNVTKGRESVQVKLMIPAQLGCPHDYALTPDDMRLLASADLLLINGLGLEEFIGPQLKQANPRLTVIDTSKGIQETLRYVDGPSQGEKEHDAHENQGANPHLFVSPRLVAKITRGVADELSTFDPEGGEVYQRNAAAYAAQMEALGQEMAALGKTLNNRKVITQHGVFDYLARDMGLEIVGVVQAHAGQEPSAAEMLAIIKSAKENKAGAIFSEPQYPGRVVQTIAREAGIKEATLDPVATGPDTPPLNYYETVMRTNIQTLQATLGKK